MKRKKPDEDTGDPSTEDTRIVNIREDPWLDVDDEETVREPPKATPPATPPAAPRVAPTTRPK